jgi:phosphatidylserine synthase 2
MLRGAYAAIGSFIMFSMVQFRDGPFIRPHPAVWRVALGINLLYELALVFLLFQDLGSARKMMTLIDPNLGVPLPEKSYAENCDFTAKNVWVNCIIISYAPCVLNQGMKDALDIFCLAHALGWFGKGMILRDYWFCWVWPYEYYFFRYF